MEPANKTTFRNRVLASGLVTREQLDATVEGLSPAGESGVAQGQQISDEQLANRLVDEGLLNRWQATELLRGHSKFYLGPYRLLDSIGQGGMGQVYKAEHTIMGRIVAVKVLPLHKASPEAITGFMREIRAQAQLDHSNLVRALDAGYDRKVHYLVTEYVPGTDLRKLVRKQGRLSMSAAASIISQAAIGLEHAHECGLIHRDVKPGNILVTPDGRAKVSDLGLIAFLNNDPVPGWQKNKTVGTADYLSPEQIKSPDNLTPASDIYSLGCTLYYTVTGKVPFPGGTQRDKSIAHCRSRPLDPSLRCMHQPVRGASGGHPHCPRSACVGRRAALVPKRSARLPGCADEFHRPIHEPEFRRHVRHIWATAPCRGPPSPASRHCNGLARSEGICRCTAPLGEPRHVGRSMRRRIRCPRQRHGRRYRQPPRALPAPRVTAMRQADRLPI